METKRCTTCGQSKPLDDFGLEPRGKYGRRAVCQECRKLPPSEQTRERIRQRAREWYADPENKAQRLAYNREWRARNREKSAEYSRAWRERNPEKRRAVWVKNKYRLTDEQYEQILAHHGVCDACEEAPAKHTDHDHKTGEYRGRLCASCNQAAGLLQDSPLRATKLAAYLVKVGCPPA